MTELHSVRGDTQLAYYRAVFSRIEQYLEDGGRFALRTTSEDGVISVVLTFEASTFAPYMEVLEEPGVEIP